MNIKYDCIIIGGGHAGCEASLACARMGLNTLLLTLSKLSIGEMSCNPAIGGLAKGQLVKEIDALGGEMAKATDSAAIQFRTLNMKKGPAVQSTRAQVDRHIYREYMRSAVLTCKNLTVSEGMAERIILKDGAVAGITTAKDEEFHCRALIITPGTFLNGLIHIGLKHFPGGRRGEENSAGLAGCIHSLGFRTSRLKTGTCPRLDKKTIDFDKLQVQNGGETITPFSFDTAAITRKQLPCHITYTNTRTHDIIRKNLDRSPLFTGVIKGTGARYCGILS